MKIYVNDEHIAAMIDAGSIELAGADIVAVCEQCLGGLPWLGTGIDWRRFGSFSSVNLSGLRPDDFLKWMLTTSLGSTPHVVVFYAPAQPGLACPIGVLAENFDAIFWKAPGRRYLFSSTNVNGAWTPHAIDLPNTMARTR